jgi:hypothetical protein
VLFDLATARLVEHKVLLPGVSRLARMVASVRHRASTRAWRMLARLPDEECPARLERLLVVPEGSHQSGLDRLRHGSRNATIDGLVEALARFALRPVTLIAGPTPSVCSRRCATRCGAVMSSFRPVAAAPTPEPTCCRAPAGRPPVLRCAAPLACPSTPSGPRCGPATITDPVAAVNPDRFPENRRQKFSETCQELTGFLS